jgi:hypothetical protein
MKIVWFAGVAALLIGLVGLPRAANSQEKIDPFFTGAPLSLSYLLESVGTIPDKRLTLAISHRGVDFKASPEDLDHLKKAGAGAELLKMISASAPRIQAAPEPPPPVEPPPPPRAGRVIFQCQPAECEVTVNGKSRGQTNKGSLELDDLLAGPAVVDFKKDGYEAHQGTYALREGAGAKHAVILKPTAATQELLGKALVTKMIERLGGQPALDASAVVAAAGNASLWQSGGQRTEWQVTTRLRLPAMALIDINGAGLKWWTSLSGSDSKADGTRKMKGEPVAVEMEKLVRMYRDYQPAMVVERIQKMKLSTPDAVIESSAQWHLQASNNDETLKITLNPDATLTHVVYESASGLGSGLEILYADWGTVDKVYYPKGFTVKFSDQPQHGLELHLQDVKFPPKLIDKEFHR